MTGYTANTSTAVSSRDWRTRALCRDEDSELFFPIGNTGPALRQIEEAKAVCRRCPVVTECLTWALDSGQDAGVWGGMSEHERRALKRRGGRLPTPAQVAELTRRRTERAGGIAAIREHAGNGLTDAETADLLNTGDPDGSRWSASRVAAARRRNDIPSGYHARQRTQGAA